MHGAVLLRRKSYVPVPCVFKKAEILRCGSVRFSKIVNATVRFGAFMYPTVRFGVVFRCTCKTYGAVRWCDTTTSFSVSLLSAARCTVQAHGFLLFQAF